MAERETDQVASTVTYLVALGASAGGLEALTAFFRRASSRRVAYVVNQHLSPDHRSVLADLLQRHTALPVRLITDGMPLAPGTLHLIPPGMRLRVESDRLRLTPRQGDDGVHYPIDDFFVSVARDWGGRAVGVVLSGTGSDGTQGLQSIARAHGKVLVQTPDSAEFDGMPRAALSALKDPEIGTPEALADLIDHWVGDESRPPRPTPRNDVSERDHAARHVEALDDDELVARVMAQLVEQHGDLSGYKSETLLKRIAERCQVLNLTHREDYLAHLAAHTSEQEFLARELLIPLTRFFRDATVFETLYEQVIAPLVLNCPEGHTLRVWCAGVASGEEAYSVSMLFQQAFHQHQRWPALKLFATDIDSRQIERASVGYYTDAIEEEMPASQLSRYFRPVADGYQVHKPVRQPIIFARHNVVTDPPFTGIDLILCRNVLIYLRADSQQQVLERLQYALNPDGVLCLGLTESPSSLSDVFHPLEAELGLYRMTADGATRRPLPRDPTPRQRPAPTRETLDSRAVDTLQAQLHQAYLPPTLIINQDRELVHVLGPAQSLLSFSGGDVTFRLERMLHPLLRHPTVQLVQEAFNRIAEGEEPPEPVRTIGPEQRIFSVQAWPYRSRAGEGRYLALSFRRLATSANDNASEQRESLELTPESEGEGRPADAGSQGGLQSALAARDRRIMALEAELQEAHESMKVTVQALETSNEELQATNEELFTANEELQSTNEELQSLNEELHSVNAEHQAKIKELHQMQQDMDSLTQAVGVAALYLDQSLSIQRFTPAMSEFLPLRPGDEGRALAEFSHQSLYPQLQADCERCLAGRQVVDIPLKMSDTMTRWVRIMPYRIRYDSADGVMVTVAGPDLLNQLADRPSEASTADRSSG